MLISLSLFVTYFWIPVIFLLVAASLILFFIMEISNSEYKADAFALSQSGDLNGIVQTLKELENFVKTNYNPSHTLDRRVEKGVRKRIARLRSE